MKNKTLGYLLIGILAVVLLIGLFIQGKEGTGISTLEDDPEIVIANAQEESAAVTEEEKKEFIQIDMNTYMSFYNGTEEKIVLIARPTCSYCQIAEPILAKIAKDYDFDIHYLNTDEFSEEDQATLVQSDEFFNEGFGTPLLLIVGNGSIINQVQGATDTAHYVQFFEQNKIIE